MVFIGQILDRSSQFLHLAPLLAVVLLLLALHDLDAVRQFQEGVGDVLGGRVHGCLWCVVCHKRRWRFGRWLRVVGSRFSLVRTASLMLRNGAARKPHSAQRAALFQPLRLRGGRSTALGQRLQNLHYVMKKDPQGYLREVKGHLDAWRAAVSAWEREPELPHQELGELSVFLGSTMGKFPSLLGDFGSQLLALLATQATGSNSTATMCSDLRLAVAKAVAIANSRKSISVPALCGVFFGLFHLP